MDKSLRRLKEVSDLIDKQRAEQAEKTKKGENEAIPQIKSIQNKNATLEQQLQDLQNQEKQMNLKLKILKKKDELIKIEQKLQAVSAEDKFYTEKPDSEGYIQLREEKWEREFQELIIQLEQIEQSQQRGEVDDETANEAKENISKKIRKLVSVKKNTTARNRMNKFKRGMNKVLKGVSSVSNEIGSISNELGKMGDMSGYGKGNNNYNFGFDTKSSTDWTKFFGDESPKRKSSTKKKGTKRKSKSKKKGTKKKSKSKKKSTGATGTEPEIAGHGYSGVSNMFEGF